MTIPNCVIGGAEIFWGIHDLRFRPFQEETVLEWAYMEGETYAIRRKGQGENAPLVLLKARSPKMALAEYREEYGEWV